MIASQISLFSDLIFLAKDLSIATLFDLFCICKIIIIIGIDVSVWAGGGTADPKRRRIDQLRLLKCVKFIFSVVSIRLFFLTVLRLFMTSFAIHGSFKSLYS